MGIGLAGFIRQPADFIAEILLEGISFAGISLERI
jgi:hypothetical protein